MEQLFCYDPLTGGRWRWGKYVRGLRRSVPLDELICGQVEHFANRAVIGRASRKADRALNPRPRSPKSAVRGFGPLQPLHQPCEGAGMTSAGPFGPHRRIETSLAAFDGASVVPRGKRAVSAGCELSARSDFRDR